MTGFAKDCALRLATAITCCALSFTAPFVMGREGLIEDRFWASARASGRVMPLESFVSQFPESRFVAEAEARIAALQTHRTARPMPHSGVSYVR